MIAFIKRVYESEPARAVAYLIGLGGGIKLIDMAFPSSEIGRTLAIAYLVFMGLCLLGYLAVKVLRASADEWVKPVLAGMERLDLRLEEMEEKLLSYMEKAPERREAADVQRLIDADQATYDYLARRYGVGYEHLEINWTIREDGSATVERTVRAVVYSDISELETALVIPDEPPSGESWNIDPVSVRSCTDDRTVVLDSFDSVNGKLSAKLQITPQLVAGEHFAYEVVEQLPAGLYAIELSQKELKQRLVVDPFDYAGWIINRPTRKFLLSVHFPVSFRPTVYDYKVRYAAVAPGMPSKMSHRDERNRLIRPSLKGSYGQRYVLSLEVDYPMIGLVYSLQWKPVPTVP
jgi:hypothetical protein